MAGQCKFVAGSWTKGLDGLQHRNRSELADAIRAALLDRNETS